MPIYISYSFKLDFQGILIIKFNQTLIDQNDGFDINKVNEKHLDFDLKIDDIENAFGNRKLVAIKEWRALSFEKSLLRLKINFDFAEEIAPYNTDKEDRL